MSLSFADMSVDIIKSVSCRVLWKFELHSTRNWLPSVGLFLTGRKSEKTCRWT